MSGAPPVAQPTPTSRPREPAPRDFFAIVADTLRLKELPDATLETIASEIYVAVTSLGSTPELFAGKTAYQVLLPTVRVHLSFEEFATIAERTVAAKSADEAAIQARDNARRAMTVAIASIDKFYHAGQFNQVFDGCEALEHKYADFDFADQIRLLHSIRAWCRYRQGNYDEAKTHILLAHGEQRALECELYICSYADGHRNPARVAELEVLIGDTIIGANAFAVRARLLPAGVDVPYRIVEEYAERYRQHGIDNPTDTNYANLMHNTGRVFLDRPRDGMTQDDLRVALTYFERAERAYGIDGNFHHRAALFHWIAATFKALGELRLYAVSAVKSSHLWAKQLMADTRNTLHVEKGLSAVVKASAAVFEAGVDRGEIEKELRGWVSGVY